MVIEVPVVGALAFHILFNIGEFPFSFYELPVKQLQFSSCPFHTIPASIHLDFPGFCQCESCLAEPERLCQGDDLTFPLVHSNSKGFKPPNNFMPKFLQGFHIGQNHIVIIHVMPETVNPCLTFDPVIHGAGISLHAVLGLSYKKVFALRTNILLGAV